MLDIAYVLGVILYLVSHTTLRRARRRQKLTQEQLEAKSGVEQAVISRIENGSIPRETTREKLEDALGLRRGSLVFGAAAELHEASR